MDGYEEENHFFSFSLIGEQKNALKSSNIGATKIYKA